jgi:hypothetical protein
MNDYADCAARAQLSGQMLAGQPWQTALAPTIFSVDGHPKAVSRGVLVPREPVGTLGGTILGCRE